MKNKGKILFNYFIWFFIALGLIMSGFIVYLGIINPPEYLNLEQQQLCSNINGRFILNKEWGYNSCLVIDENTKIGINYIIKYTFNQTDKTHNYYLIEK